MGSFSGQFYCFLKGLVDAGRGIVIALKDQRNLKIHLLATILVVAAGFYFPIRSNEWLILLLTIGLVWTAELLNTAIEYLTDLITKDHHALARKAKDASAGGVLTAAIIALIIAIIIFGKHFT